MHPINYSRFWLVMAGKLEEWFDEQAESHETRLAGLAIIYQRVLQGPLPMMMYAGERKVIAAQYCRSICYGGRPCRRAPQRYIRGWKASCTPAWYYSGTVEAEMPCAEAASSARMTIARCRSIELCDRASSQIFALSSAGMGLSKSLNVSLDNIEARKEFNQYHLHKAAS